MRDVVFSALEVLMVVLIVVGLGSWVAPGAGLAVGGVLGLVLLALAQKPARGS